MPMKNIETQIGERIRSLREAKGLLQRELADSASLPVRTIGRIERGEVDMRLSTLVKIAKALKVNFNDLIP
jgi:transcriptional regulator with XRE-family HTH domain